MRTFTLPAVMIALAAHASDFAGPDQFICGTATVMQANPPAAGELGFWTVVQGTAVFANITSPTTQVTGLGIGENVLRWNLQSAAGVVSDLVSIFCYDPSMPPADAGPDQSVALWQGAAQLSASAPSGLGECFWSVVAGSGSFSDPADPQATVTGLAAGLNVLRWSCFNGPCGNSSDLVVIDAVVGIDEGRASLALLRLEPEHRQLRSHAPAHAQVADGQGRIVLSGSIGPSATLSLAGLPPGLYLARAEGDGGASVLRFALE